MKRRDRFVLGCLLVGASAVACSSQDISSNDSAAGSSGTSTGGTQSGGSSSVSGGSTATGGSSGSISGSAGSSSAAGTSPGAGGKSAGGAGGGGGHPLAGSGGTGSTSVAGADTSSAGEAGASNQPLLQNGSFELGTLSFWTATVTPSNVGRAIYTQWGPYDGNTRSIDGKYEAAFWNGTDNFQGDLHQTVTGLTPGKYELKLYVAFGLGVNAAYVYAINCGPQDVTQDLPIADGAADFTAVTLPSIYVTNTSCTVGIFADMNMGNWLNVDDFVLNRLPPPAN